MCSNLTAAVENKQKLIKLIKRNTQKLDLETGKKIKIRQWHKMLLNSNAKGVLTLLMTYFT